MIEVFGPFVLILAVIFIAIQVYLREGRNPVLEGMIEHGEIGPLTRFRGSLDIEEHRPGVFLRLSKKSRLAGQLQFRYRWLVGIGPQARYDDVTFDVSKGSVELTDRGKRTTLNFS
ncbi:MAG TPA: hypothetical protein VFJ47_02245, partial [Terriglobales bacterium]|nr:hypothetical protein [Terriglobales bacterium]